MKVGVDIDEKTGYDASRRAGMVLAANILCNHCDSGR